MPAAMPAFFMVDGARLDKTLRSAAHVKASEPRQNGAVAIQSIDVATIEEVRVAKFNTAYCFIAMLIFHVVREIQ